MLKRVSFLISVISIFLLLAACGNSGGQSAPASTPSGTGNSSESPPASQPAGSTPLKLTIAGGSAGGFWSVIGEGTGNVLRQAIPGIQVSYETGNGVKNILSVANGEIPLGLAHNFEIKTGLQGEEPFKEKVPEILTLATVYNNSPHQVIISKEFSDKYGITSMEDIAEKKPPIRVTVNQRGNLLEKVNRIIFEAYGISYDDIKAWGGEVYYEPYKTGSEMMKDNKADWIGASVFAPDGIILELASSKEIKILSINEQSRKLLNERLGLQPGVITAGTYQFQTEEVQTVNVGAMLMADPKMSSDDGYLITKTLVEELEKIKAIHKNLTVLTPEIMADVSPAKLHPGAEKYYKEIGVLK